jgi:hypothetical protein
MWFYVENSGFPKWRISIVLGKFASITWYFEKTTGYFAVF